MFIKQLETSGNCRYISKINISNSSAKNCMLHHFKSANRINMQIMSLFEQIDRHRHITKTRRHDSSTCCTLAENKATYVRKN